MDFHQPTSFFSNSEIVNNHHKRRKEMEAPAVQSCSSSLFTSSFLPDLSSQINLQQDEIDQLLHDHCERLRRTLTETLRRQQLALIGSAESISNRRLLHKQAELDRAIRLSAELQSRFAHLKTELMTWQSQALSNQSTAASLHARLQQATAQSPAQADPAEPDSNRADDAESAHVDPARLGSARLCRVCRSKAACVVLLPCRHLSLCDTCDVAAGCDGACPVCHCVCTGCVQVFLS